MLDWLIVGGGIHGTYLSFDLTRLRGVARDQIRVLDPYETPLARWDACTHNTGMAFLRSPHVQSLDHDPWSISTFAKTSAGKPIARFIPTHNRPSLELFRAHCDWMVQRHGLADLRVTGRAQGLERIDGGWRVLTDSGAIESRHVILAIGATEQPLWADWARRLREQDAPIHHIYDAGFMRESVNTWSHLVVVGGGITAAQTALAYTQEGRGRVTLLMRREARVVPFDSDLCWIGANCLTEFHRIQDVDERRRVITRARHKGTMPADVYASVQQLVTKGSLEIQIGEISDAAVDDAGMSLALANGMVQADRVILATGFDSRRPGGAWLDAAVERYALPVASCGYPIVDTTLRWADGLYVSGPLAELEIGPVSRNIIGARFAGERIRRAVVGTASTSNVRC